MYEPPITQQIAEHFEREVENQIYKAVLQVGVDVDKDELIRALQYDRHQYEKGYKDGFRDGYEKATNLFTGEGTVRNVQED